MPEYRRWRQSGETYFFTVVTDGRRPIFADPVARTLLGQAIVLLPDHLHAIWAMPEQDGDYSLRWRRIKSQFTRDYLAFGGDENSLSSSRVSRKERGVWQRRFWEHRVRNEQEYETLCRYIHYNPVKHGYAGCPHGWEFSSFHAFVR